MACELYKLILHTNWNRSTAVSVDQYNANISVVYDVDTKTHSKIYRKAQELTVLSYYYQHSFGNDFFILTPTEHYPWFSKEILYVHNGYIKVKKLVSRDLVQLLEQLNNYYSKCGEYLLNTDRINMKSGELEKLLAETA